MRLLVVSNLFPPNVVGGYERLCAEVGAELAARGHEVHVLTSGDGGLQDRSLDLAFREVRRSLCLLTGATIYEPFPGDAAARDALNQANLDALSTAIREVRPEVVFAWNLFFLDRSFLHALGGCGVPVAVMLTDNWLLVMERPDYLSRFFREHVFGTAPFPMNRPAGLRAWITSRFRQSRPASDLHVPLAAVFGAHFVQELYADAGITFGASRVAHNGVRPLARPGSAPVRSRQPGPDAARLLFAGRLVDLKGAHVMVEAMPLLHRAGAAGCTLTIVGDTRDAAYVETLRAAIRSSPCADRIELRPPVREEDLLQLFAEHDIYVFPSLYEPFSLTLIHALASGIPTAASDAGGNVEIVRDGVTGVVFRKGDPADLAEAVLRLLRDPGLRSRVSEAGRAAAAEFTFDRMVGGMEAFLRDVVALQGASRTASLPASRTATVSAR